jgi:hypothetical protein
MRQLDERGSTEDSGALEKFGNDTPIWRWRNSPSLLQANDRSFSKSKTSEQVNGCHPERS